MEWEITVKPSDFYTRFENNRSGAFGRDVVYVTKDDHDDYSIRFDGYHFDFWFWEHFSSAKKAIKAVPTTLRRALSALEETAAESDLVWIEDPETKNHTCQVPGLVLQFYGESWGSGITYELLRDFENLGRFKATFYHRSCAESKQHVPTALQQASESIAAMIVEVEKCSLPEQDHRCPSCGASDVSVSYARDLDPERWTQRKKCHHCLALTSSIADARTIDELRVLPGLFEFVRPRPEFHRAWKPLDRQHQPPPMANVLIRLVSRGIEYRSLAVVGHFDHHGEWHCEGLGNWTLAHEHYEATHWARVLPADFPYDPEVGLLPVQEEKR